LTDMSNRPYCINIRICVYMVVPGGTQP
jgi:hypothetical protein